MTVPLGSIFFFFFEMGGVEWSEVEGEYGEEGQLNI